MSSPLTNPHKDDSEIGKVIPLYLSSSTTRKAYYNETPAIHLEASDVKKKRHHETGQHVSCSNIEFGVKWSATVSSSVFSTPLVFTSSEGKKHVLVSTFYQTLEMLTSTGFRPWGWPTTFEGSTFQGTPVLYDVDGDGIDDIGVVDKNANVFFVRTGEFGQYLEDYHMQVPSLRVKKDWHVGLDAEFMDYNSMMSMFDRKQNGYQTSSQRAGESAAEGGAVKPKVVRPDDLSLSRPPPKPKAGSGTARNSVLRPRPAVVEAPPHGRRLLAVEAEERGAVEDDLHSFRGAANHHGLEHEGSQEGGAQGEGDVGDLHFDGEGRPPALQTDDFGPSSSRHDFYYGASSGSGRRPFRSYDDGYHYDMMGVFNESAYVNIDPHVLGSPVVVDVNNDGKLELIMAVSYYFDKADHAAMQAEGNIDFDPSNYIAGGVACWDLAAQQWAWTVHLDLTTDKTKFKALIYATPTVADIDGDSRYEVLIGTSLGLLYVLDGETGFARRHFPMQFHEIQAQIAVADVRGGLHLEIIVADMGGNLVLLDIDGEVLWDAKLSGTLPYTPTVGDVDGDGQLDVVVVAMQETTSHLWVVDGATGVALLGYPIKLPGGGQFSASALLVDLSVYANANAKQSKEQQQQLSSTAMQILVPSFDGHVYVIDGAKRCYDRIDVGDHIFSTPLLDDITGDGLLDLVLGTINGQVLSLGTSLPTHPRNVWDSFPRSRGNGFVSGQTGIWIAQDLGLQPRKDPTADHQNYTISFEIWDERKEPALHGATEQGNTEHASAGPLGLERRYDVTIAANSNQASPLFRQTFHKPGVYTASFPITPPEHLALVVTMVNDHGLKYQDSFVLQVTTTFHSAIKYLSLSVIAGLAGLLLILV